MVKIFIEKTKVKVKDFGMKHSGGKQAKFWLFVMSFTESFISPIPPDILLSAVLVAGQAKRWVYYTTLTVIGSVLGAVVGYLIGSFFFDLFGERLIASWNMEEQVESVGSAFSDNAFWAMFIAALTPLPFKIFTISAGLFRIDFVVFLIASILGRGLRLYAVGYLVKAFGPRIAYLSFKYLNIVTIIVAVGVAFYVLLRFL